MPYGKNRTYYGSNKKQNNREKKPRATYVLNSKEQFINPYNFVSFDPDKKIRTKRLPEKDEGKLTGVLECRIVAKTPLAIPDTDPSRVIENPKEHKCYHFMRVPGQERQGMIPGSSIRGVIRSTYETVTDSCLSTMNKDTRVSKRITAKEAAHVKAGILVRIGKDTWSLKSAKRYMIKIKQDDRRHMINQDVWDQNLCPQYEIPRPEGGKRRVLCDRETGEEYVNGSFIHFRPLLDGNEEVYYLNRQGSKCAPVAQRILPKNTKGGVGGYLVIGEDIFNKHHDSIFRPTGKDVSDPDKIKIAMNGLEHTLAIYRNEKINRKYQSGHYGYRDYEFEKKAGIIPVWYVENGDNLYLQLAAVGRRAFTNTLNDVAGTHAPCTDSEHLCKACSLFGMVGDNESLGSHIRVTDAIMGKGDITEDYKCLSELGQPRSNYSAFYNKVSQQKVADGKDGYDDEEVTIRGRKYYWHHDDFQECREKNNRNASMELAKKGAEFSFKVYFECISEQQLRELIWTITLGENDENGHFCLKIGRGKPLGLGSIKIVVDKVALRGYKEKENGGYRIEDVTEAYTPQREIPSTLDRTAAEQILRICDLNALKNEKAPVRYPYIYTGSGVIPKKQNDAANHKWFTENKTVRAYENPKEKVQLLPDIMDKQALKAYELKYE